MLNKLRNLLDILVQINNLPIAQLRFFLEMNPDNIKTTYKYFTKPHPKYKFIKNKSLGAALINLREFAGRDAYLEKIKGRNSGAHHAKKAKSRGHVLVEIDRNDFIDDIHKINTSVEVRQGRPMDASYLEKTEHYESISNFKYYGVMNADGKLVAYCTLGFYGDFAGFDRIIGYRNNDGVMHFMVVEITCRLIEEGALKYLMYDTYFGSAPSFKIFKAMLGFKPYRAIYSIQ